MKHTTYRGEANRKGIIQPQGEAEGGLTADFNCLTGSYKEGSIQLFREVPSRRARTEGSYTAAKDVPVRHKENILHRKGGQTPDPAA